MALLGLVEQRCARMMARRATAMNTTRWRRRHWERRMKPSREWGELRWGVATVPARLRCWLTSSPMTVGLTAAAWRLVQDGSCKEEDGIVKPWFWCSEEERNKASGLNPYMFCLLLGLLVAPHFSLHMSHNILLTTSCLLLFCTCIGLTFCWAVFYIWPLF